MKYMEREHSAARRILCLIMAITMLLPVSNLWALEIGIQLLDGGESLIVSSGETVTADDADVRTTSRDGSDVDSVTAVRGDDTDSEYVFNGDVTVEEDGSISATITEDTDLPSGDVFAQGIEADEGDVLITNDGSITASALIEGFDEPHAIGVMIHNFNAAVLEDPETGVVNNGDITASAIQYNSAGAGATARGIQTGGGSNNTFENLTITNNEGATITVHAESKNETASALGIKTGGYIDGLNITNDGTIDADAKGDGETSARGIRVAGNITGDYSIDNNGTITADATSVDDDAIVRGIHVSGYDTSGTVSEDIVIFAGTEDEKTVSLTVYNTVVDPTALTITNEGTIDVTADGDYEANARAIHAGDRYTGLTITNGIDGELIATAIAEEDDANARAIHTGENNTGLDLENKGLIGADASSSTYDASATGIKLGEDNDGAITNSGTIKATASTTAYDEGAAARGIHIGNDDYYSSYYDAVSDRTYYYDDDGSPGDDSVDIINEEGGTISATAAASFGGAAGARGIHAGDDSIGTITNAGTISAVAEGGYSGDSPSYGTKAFAVHTEGGLTLENEGDITADIKLKTQDSDSVSSSRAIGVFVSRIDDTDDDVSIINSSGAAIEATADFQVAYDIDDNPAAIGIKLSDGYITSPTDTDTSLSRSIDNAGEISAASKLVVFEGTDDNPGAEGVKAGRTYVNNGSYTDQTLTSSLDISNSGTISAETDMRDFSDIGSNAGAFGIRSGETNAYNYVSGSAEDPAGAVAATTIENSGQISSQATMEAPDIDYNSGAWAIRTGQTYAYDNAAGDGGTASATTNISNSEDGIFEAIAVLTAKDSLGENSGAYGVRAGSTYANGDDATATTTIDNSGTITSDARITSPAIDENIGAFGIRVGNDSNYASDGEYNVIVANDGSINASATIDTDSSSENNGAYGIRTGTAMVVNSGDITANATMDGANDSDCDGAYGIRTGHGKATVVHSGTINASLTDNDDSTMQRAVGIMTGQGDNAIHLSGSVAATATGGDAYSVIVGCENGGGSDNMLYVMNGAELTGDILNDGDGTATALLGVAKDADGMAIDGETDADFALAFDGSFLGNDTYTGITYWNAAVLAGSLEGNIVIDGDYTQSAEATYRALLGDGAAAELEVSGDADFANGAVIEIGTSGYVADGSVHTIVNSATLAPADDAAQEALLTESALVLDYTLVEGEATKITVLADRASYASVGASSNAIGVGSALIAMATDGNADANSYIGMVDSCSTVDCINEGYGALAPEQYPSLLDLSQTGNAAFGSVISGRMGNLHIVQGKQEHQYATNTITANGPVNSRLPAFDRRAEGWSSWARVLGVFGEQDDDGALQGWDFDTYGISVGADNKISRTTAVGFGLGFASTEADFDNNSQSSDIDSFFGSVYGTYSVADYYIDGSIIYAGNDYDSVRSIPLLGASASSSTDGSELGLMIGGGYNVIDTEAMFFIPTASVRWGNTDIDGFTETGAGTFNLEVDDYDATSFITTLGFRWGGTMGKEGKFEPELRFAWAHEFGDTDREARVRFADQSQSFTIKSVEPEEDSALLGLGVNYFVKENLTLYVDYDGEYRDGYAAHAIGGGLRYDF